MDDIDWSIIEDKTKIAKIKEKIAITEKEIFPQSHKLYLYSTRKKNVGMITIKRSGAYIKFEDHSTDRLRSIQNWFTIKTKISFKDMFKRISGYKYFPDTEEVCVPRFGIFDKIKSMKNMSILQFANPIVENTLDDYKMKYDLTEDFTLNGILSHNQKITISWLMKNVYTTKKINRGIAGCITQMPTGTGKTFLGAGLIAECKVPTLVVCRDTGDCAQWVKTLKVLFPTATVGEYHSKRKVDGDIVVAVFNSVANVKEFTMSHPIWKSKKIIKSPDQFFKRFGLSIWDECHEYCTKSGILAFKRAQTLRMMGLTATPYSRPDNFNKVAEWYLGPVIDAMGIDNYEHDDVTYKCRVKAVQYNGPPEYTNPIYNKTTEQISTTGMIQQFIEDPYRLQMICEFIIDLYQKGKNILVFADRKEYLVIIGKALSKYHKTDSQIFTDEEQEKKIITGGAKDTELQNLQYARIVLTTYAYFGTGKSVKHLNAIVFATPRKSHTMQFIGRIFRKDGDPSIRRYIIDIIDKKTSLHRQYYSRKKVYDIQQQIGRTFTIQKVQKDYSEIKFETYDDIPKKFTKDELSNIIKSLIK